MAGRQHSNNLCIVVPDHSPEVFCGVGQRMLGNDELITPVVTLLKKQQQRISGRVTPHHLHHIHLDLGSTETV